MTWRFHVLGIPHTISTPEYSTCAFTQKVVKLCKMLHGAGHEVIHYGHKDSVVECSEHVTVTNNEILAEAYGEHDWRKLGHPNNFRVDDAAYLIFYGRAVAQISKRKQPGDFLLCMFGSGHKEVADRHKDMIVVEPGIGYPGGHFAPFKVFESYAILHAYLGLGAVAESRNSMWYDWVIPNYFDPADFTYSQKKEDYFLFLGRVDECKGAHIAAQIAKETGMKLIIAGQGRIGNEAVGGTPLDKIAECVGVVGPERRRELLSKARAVICASTFVEPFCGVQIEAMMSGTPVISTDWGAFTEYNLHGVTGYRCRTFEQFMWAARNIRKIDRHECRQWACDNFSMAVVLPMYEEFFSAVASVASGKGWYEPRERNEVWPLGVARG